MSTKTSGAQVAQPPTIVPLALPAGAITIAPPPALFGVACASYLGMSEGEARRVLAEMRSDKAFTSCVMVLSRRPLSLAAAPEDVVRFLRTRSSPITAEAAPPANDAVAEADDGSDVLAEMGLRRNGSAHR